MFYISLVKELDYFCKSILDETPTWQDYFRVGHWWKWALRTSKIKNSKSYTTKEMSYSTVINIIVIIEGERITNQCILINTTIAFSESKIDPNFTLSPLMSKTSKSDTSLMVVSSGNALKSAMMMIVQSHVAESRHAGIRLWPAISIKKCQGQQSLRGKWKRSRYKRNTSRAYHDNDLQSMHCQCLQTADINKWFSSLVRKMVQWEGRSIDWLSLTEVLYEFLYRVVINV